MKPTAALWRLAIIGAVGVVLFILVANAVTQPEASAVRSYTAEFTDSTGLHPGADVRVRGVRVGKVQTVELQRHDDQSVSSVNFTLEARYGVVANTRLAIKYQSLTGSRYIDIVNAAESYKDVSRVSHIPSTMTQPSFDVTALFNGLQPVLATLNPDEINQFTQTAVDYLEGDGSGLAPMLKSIHTLTRFVANRQQVISAVINNLSTVAQGMGGQSQQMIQILDWINRPLNSALQVIDQFRTTDLFSTGFLLPVLKLVSEAGFPVAGNNGMRYVTQPPGHQDLNATNIDDALDRAFNNVDEFIEAFKLVPVIWANVKPPAESGAPLPCSKGRFQLPEQMDVLLNGQRVVLCKP
jgi:phospholipid/cholesterol/gamma-HCH transport system substrate-binding protein